MGVLLGLIRRYERQDRSWEEVADELLGEFRAEKKRVPGLGHRIHSDDPRTRRLFTLAEEAGVSGAGVQAMSSLARGLARQGKNLPINVDGALAALLVDLEFDPSVANAFFIMARVPGLVAHVREEVERQRPMRRVDPEQHEYDGPAARSMEA